MVPVNPRGINMAYSCGDISARGLSRVVYWDCRCVYAICSISIIYMGRRNRRSRTHEVVPKKGASKSGRGGWRRAFKEDVAADAAASGESKYVPKQAPEHAMAMRSRGGAGVIPPKKGKGAKYKRNEKHKRSFRF